MHMKKPTIGIQSSASLYSCNAVIQISAQHPPYTVATRQEQAQNRLLVGNSLRSRLEYVLPPNLNHLTYVPAQASSRPSAENVLASVEPESHPYLNRKIGRAHV